MVVVFISFFSNRGLALGYLFKDGPPGRVGQRRKDGIEVFVGLFNHMV
jgi:hypothetical protein